MPRYQLPYLEVILIVPKRMVDRPSHLYSINVYIIYTYYNIIHNQTFSQPMKNTNLSTRNTGKNISGSESNC